MALSIYTKSCAKNIAGNNAVLVTEASNIDSVSVDASGEVTGITMVSSATFKQLQADQDSIARLEEAAGSESNLSFTHSVQMAFAKGSVNLNTLRDSLAAASACGMVAIVQDANGKSWLVGYNEVDGTKRALRLVQDNYASGASPADEGVQKADIILESISGYTDLPLDSALNALLTAALLAGAGTAIEWTPIALGPELVVNGDFATDTVWDKAVWTISGGEAHLAGASGDNLAQLNILTIGDTCRLTFSITAYTTGTLVARLGTGGYGTGRSAVGTYTQDIVVTTTDDLILDASAFTGSVDNVSCKKVL